jgi:hypothetical protein
VLVRGWICNGTPLGRFGEVKLGAVRPWRGWTQLRSVLPVRPDRPVISASSMSPWRASAALPSSVAALVSLAVAAACSAEVVTVVQSCLNARSCCRPVAACGAASGSRQRRGARVGFRGRC